jgi:hypothetical protein
MKIAILYIATGKYFVFWERFYASAKQYLFCNTENQLHFFVFTDEDRELGPDVHVTVVNNEQWPYPTLKRYHHFLQLKEKLQQFDYIYFFNGNTVFLRPVGEEILPKSGTNFAFVRQPFTLTQKNTEFGYERRPESKAFIPLGKGKYYIWGAFNGGCSESFLKMASIIRDWTDEDLKIPLITAFWDESYINRYLLELKEEEYTLVNTDLFLVSGYNEDDANAQATTAIHIFEKSRFFDTSFKKTASFRHRVGLKMKRLLGGS